MSELKTLKRILNIDDDCYDAIVENGHIVDLCIHDREYIDFQFEGDLIKALSIFTGLKRLEIELDGYTITDIGSIVNLTSLESLWLYNCCKLEDISPLENLKQLKNLLISNAEINDINCLSDLKNLSVLHLPGNQLTSLSALKGYTQFTNVNLSYNKLSDVSALSNCRAMHVLRLDYNEINDLSFVAEFSEIEDLSFTKNKVSNVDFLSDLSRLKWLSFSNNPITDITALGSLTELISLTMQDVLVNDLKPIKNAKKLNHLSAGPVANFNGQIISQLNQLMILNLQHCSISDIDFLKPLKKILNLNLSYNEIENIDVLYQLVSLQSLFLRHNNISTALIPHRFSFLTKIDLRENVFGGKLFVPYVAPFSKEDESPIIELNRAVADSCIKQNDWDSSLAFFYIYEYSKISLKIRYEKLLHTDPNDSYFLKYNIIACVSQIIRLINADKNLFDDNEVWTIYNQLKEVIARASITDKKNVLESLNSLKLSYKYIPHAEYVKYLIDNYPYVKKDHPEMIFEMGRIILKKDTLTKVLSLYKVLVETGSSFQYPLYKLISNVLKSNFSALESAKKSRYKYLLDNIKESKLPYFDLIAYYQENYSTNLSPEYQKSLHLAPENLLGYDNRITSDPMDFEALLMVFYYGLIYGIISAEQVIEWADRIVMHENEPDYFFIELSLGHNKNGLVNILNLFKRPIDTITTRVLFSLLYHKLYSRLITVDKAITVMNTYDLYENLTPYEKNFIYTLEDENLEDPQLVIIVLKFLMNYKNFNLNNLNYWGNNNYLLETKFNLMVNETDYYESSLQINRNFGSTQPVTKKLLKTIFAAIIAVALCLFAFPSAAIIVSIIMVCYILKMLIDYEKHK